MFVVISILFAGISAGYLFRRSGIIHKISGLITVLIWLLLLFLGISVGSNHEVISHLGTLGGTALLLSLAGTLGSVLLAALVYRSAFKKKEGDDER